MPTDQPVQVVKLRWKKSSYCDCFGAIQVVLSNGIESPVFLAENQTADNLTEVPINACNIARIRGTNNNNWLYEIVLQDKDGLTQALMQAKASGQFGADQLLMEGEQIVGVHGSKNRNNYFACLGFIVWTPPRF